MFLVDGSGNVVCTGALSTKFSQWMGNHPIAKWAAIYLAADAAINVAATLIAAFAGEAIAAAIAGGEMYSEVVLEEYLVDPEQERNIRIWNLIRQD
jgi:enoyl reductase-like protein